METSRLKTELVYGGYIALLWLLGGLAFYYILNIITQSPEEDSSLLCHYSSYIVIGIVISWMHSRTYYSLNEWYLTDTDSTCHSENPDFTKYHKSRLSCICEVSSSSWVV